MKLLFFGPPGCGKGTYASRVGVKLGIAHISTGDMFRAEAAAGTKLGKMAEKYMKEGRLMPDDLTIDMLKERIKKKDCKKGFILDGFPRTIKQMRALEKIIAIDLVINFNLSEDILTEKALARRTCEKCGAIYNVADIKRGKIHLPPLPPKKEGICDKCGGKIIQRQDDNYKTIKARQDLYWKQSEPLLKEYRKRKTVKDINVIGPPDIMVPVIIELIKQNVNKLTKILLDTNIYGWAVEDKAIANLLSKLIKEKKRKNIVFGFDTIKKELDKNPHRPTKIKTLKFYNSVVSRVLQRTSDVKMLAEAYFEACKNLKVKITIEDCEIVAAAVVNNADFIVTNNRRTMNNPKTLKIFESINLDNFKMPKIIDSREAITKFSF